MSQAVRLASTNRLRMPLLVVLLVLLNAPAAAVDLAYATRMDYAEWHAGGDKLRCQLQHDIKRFGTAIFEQRAGSGTQFVLQAYRNPMVAAPASLISQAPIWAPELPSRELATVNVHSAREAVVVGDRLANTMLAELSQGMAPQFSGVAWFDSQQTVNVQLSPKHFLRAYDEFQSCIDGMLAKSFEQIARNRVHFDSNKDSLSAAARAQLQEIVDYMAVDKSVRRVFVDGHTDDVHDRDYNIGLSKRRARAVTDYLVKSGVNRRHITTRYHGERYPVTPNRDHDSRAKNRRVTVRLER